jgi:hypothetical protein
MSLLVIIALPFIRFGAFFSDVRVIRHWSTARSSEWLSGVILRRTLAEGSARPNCRDVLQVWRDGLGMGIRPQLHQLGLSSMLSITNLMGALTGLPLRIARIGQAS